VRLVTFEESVILSYLRPITHSRIAVVEPLYSSRSWPETSS
jgi:hypothetical protein